MVEVNRAGQFALIAKIFWDRVNFQEVLLPFNRTKPGHIIHLVVFLVAFNSGYNERNQRLKTGWNLRAIAHSIGHFYIGFLIRSVRLVTSYIWSAKWMKFIHSNKINWPNFGDWCAATLSLLGSTISTCRYILTDFVRHYEVCLGWYLEES